jgi:hypothetical protein
MECKACGHKHYAHDWSGDELVIKHQDTDEFIYIHGNFTIKKDIWSDYKEDVALFACPRCFTVIMKS